jgi:hypothetical protein
MNYKIVTPRYVKLIKGKQKRVKAEMTGRGKNGAPSAA